MNTKPTLPFSKQISYAIGQLGWSILVNLIGLMLVYFYLPPETAKLPFFITQVIFLGVLNVLTIVAASGRMVDAITDPLIASYSDRFNHKRGRRIPFMAMGALPAALFCFLIFVPPLQEMSGWNIVWLAVTQILFYVFLTLYVTPFFALLPELGHTADERLNLSTWISVTYALGIVVAAQTPLLADIMQDGFGLSSRVSAIQAAIGVMAVLALIFMAVPIFTIDERKYCDGKPSTVPLFTALKSTFENANFRYYVVADFSYFMGLTIMNTGLLYYITVLLGLEEALVGMLLIVMVVVSFVFYPVVNVLAKKAGKRVLVIGSFLSMSLVFMGVYFFGRTSLDPTLQAYMLVLFYSVPLSFLSVLPNAILADIAEHDALQSGERKEGMFFAARTLMQKFGQTFGILVFATLTTFGKDPGDDLGIRLSGVAGFLLCLGAGLAFTRYNERKLMQETAQLQMVSDAA